MSNFDLHRQAASGVPTPSPTRSTVFVNELGNLAFKRDDGTTFDTGLPGSAITSLTGEVTGSGPGAASTTVSNSAVLNKVLTGLASLSGNILATDSVLTAFGKLSTKQNAGFFGVPSDGAVVYSSDFTFVRDTYHTTIVVNPGVILSTGGFRIFASVSVENNGIIDRSGNNGVGVSAGAALVAGTLAGSGAGGAGAVAAGAAGGSLTNSLGGSGGAGGAGSGGVGGAAGNATAVTAVNGGVEVLNTYNRAVTSQNLANTIVTAGAGGGGGGGDGTAGGGAGSGAGVIVIAARTIFGTGTIRANGGNGGTPVAGNRGGGGGGGGGVLILISENDTTMTSLTLQVNGGLGSSGTGTGVTGSNGSVGRIYRVRV